MCGRYVIEDNNDIGEMHTILEKIKENYGDTHEFQKVKAGEVAPTGFAPIIIPAKDDKIDAIPMRWGFFNKNKSGLMINARSEGIYERYTFKRAIVNKRCVIPTNGFFEWQKLNDGKKSEKYLIKKTSNPMLYLAGIYDNFVDTKSGRTIYQFVIITREARGLIRSIHSRMPVHVEKRDILKWLNGDKNHVREIFEGDVPDYSFTNLSV